MEKLAVVILAAGEGTRMKSSKAKVLHPVNDKPMIRWVLDASKEVKADAITLVVGHAKEQIIEELKDEKIRFAIQSKQLGSGHALMQAEKHLKNFRGNIIVLCGDVPLINPETIKGLLKIHKKENNYATVLSAVVEDPFSYGRIYRDCSGSVKEIIEEKDASLEVKKINEVNSGIYCFKSPEIWKALKQVKPNNVKKEYYLTDVIKILSREAKKTGAYPEAKYSEMLGINHRVDLAKAENISRKNTLKKIMMSGVTVTDPETTYVSASARIGSDTVLYPGTIIQGKTVIGNKCEIGPYTIIKESIVEDNCKIGPFSHIRPYSHLKQKAHVGNFSELKKSTIGEGSKINHLSYIGDSTLGKNVNIGAGTITCNYDGVKKHQTIIGDGAFVGSNCNLVAPVKIGKNVLLGAGSTITDNVPDGALALARSRQINKARKKG